MGAEEEKRGKLAEEDKKQGGGGLRLAVSRFCGRVGPVCFEMPVRLTMHIPGWIV